MDFIHGSELRYPDWGVSGFFKSTIQYGPDTAAVFAAHYWFTVVIHNKEMSI
jgi:hypothetical protein